MRASLLLVVAFVTPACLQPLRNGMQPRHAPVCDIQDQELERQIQRSIESVSGRVGITFGVGSLPVGVAEDEVVGLLGEGWSCTRQKRRTSECHAAGSDSPNELGLLYEGTRLERIRVILPCGLGDRESICAQFLRYRRGLSERLGAPAANRADLCSGVIDPQSDPTMCASWPGRDSQLSLIAQQVTELESRFVVELVIDSVPGYPPRCGAPPAR